MKKFLLIFFLFLIFDISVYAEDIKITIDEETVATPSAPIIENGRTMVPVRGVFEHMGAVVRWESGTVRINCGEDEIVLKVGRDWLLYNGEEKKLETVTKIVNDRAYIPVRAVSELLDCEVFWEEESRQVNIYTNAGKKSYLKEYEVFVLVNDIRKMHGFEEFEWSEELHKAAEKHARDMQVRNFFSHENPDGKSPFERMREYGIEYLFAAENIAKDYTDAKSVVNAWMNSESHRENILNPHLKKIGVGYYSGYWCQEFTD